MGGGVELGLDFAMTVTTDGKMAVSNVSTPLRSWTAEPWHTAQDSVFHAQAHWLHCLLSGQVAETSGEDNLKTYALVEAAYASASTGQAVSMAKFVENSC